MADFLSSIFTTYNDVNVKVNENNKGLYIVVGVVEAQEIRSSLLKEEHLTSYGMFALVSKL